MDQRRAGQQVAGDRVVEQVAAERGGRGAGAVVVGDAAPVAGLLDVQAGGAGGVDGDRAGVHTRGGQRADEQAPEPVVADPADPGGRQAEGREAARHVGLRAADQAVEHRDVFQGTGRGGHEHGHRLAQAHRQWTA